MILFGGEISISRQIVTAKPNPQVIAPLGGSGIARGVILGGCVDSVCDGQVIFQAGYLCWDCALQREEVI